MTISLLAPLPPPAFECRGGMDEAASGGGGGARTRGGTSDHRSTAPCPEARPRDAEAAQGVVHPRALQNHAQDDTRPFVKDAASAGNAAHATAPRGVRETHGAGQGGGDRRLQPIGGRPRQPHPADVGGGDLQLRHCQADGHRPNLLSGAGGCACPVQTATGRCVPAWARLCRAEAGGHRPQEEESGQRLLHDRGEPRGQVPSAACMGCVADALPQVLGPDGRPHGEHA
eukprot:4161300-Prymnesium_polylepis.1